MTLKEIQKKREKLACILGEENTESRLKKLQELAKEVGASITRVERVETQRDVMGAVTYKPSNEITETEIVHNINFALQTETMIEMCRISARSHWIALVATIISLLAMVAAWIAAFAK